MASGSHQHFFVLAGVGVCTAAAVVGWGGVVHGPEIPPP